MIQIREIFDNPVPYRITTKTLKKFEVYFKVEKIGYTFTATGGFLSDNKYNFLLTFSSNTTLKNYRGDMILTGEGNPYVVFSTLAKIMEEFIKKYKPYEFSFTAKEESRKKIYRIFTKKLSKKFNYSMNIETLGNEDEEYILTKRG